MGTEDLGFKAVLLGVWRWVVLALLPGDELGNARPSPQNSCMRETADVAVC